MAIAEKWSLPSTELSHRVLKELSCGELNTAEAPDSLRAKLVELRDQYLRKREEIGTDRPRNLPYYLMIKEKYPQFNWVDLHPQPQIETYFRGFKPNLLSYLLEMIPSNEIASSARVSRQVNSGVPVWLMETCQPVFEREGLCPVDEATVMRLHEWVQAGRAGKTLTIVSPVCPDYSAEQGESRKFRFTFNSVGTGVGLACTRLFQSLAALHELFADVSQAPRINVLVLVGDFEAFSPENCHRVGLSTEDFVVRLRQSCMSIVAAAPLPLTAALFTSLCGGQQGWQRSYADMKSRMAIAGLHEHAEHPMVKDIAAARKPLYSRWFGKGGEDDAFYERMVIDQGAEYALMGEVIKRSIAHPLVIGADHHKMAPFYNFASDMPVLYLDRNYD